MKLLRIGFANFRSIGAEPVILDLTKRVNLLIGANNSGKSNVLEAFRLLQKSEKEKTALHQIRLSGTNLHLRDNANGLQLIFECEPVNADELPHLAAVSISHSKPAAPNGNKRLLMISTGKHSLHF